MQTLELGRRTKVRKWDLPVFIATRQKTREDESKNARNYIMKAKDLYLKPSVDDISVDTPSSSKEALNPSYPKCKRKSEFPGRPTVKSDASIPPNRYAIKEVLRNVPTPIYKRLRPNNLPPPPAKMDESPFYVDPFKRGFGFYSFPFDQRYRKPTLRHFVTSLIHCYRLPTLPGPNQYYVKEFIKHPSPEHRIFVKKGLPWIFYKSSNVPARLFNEIRPKPTRLSPWCYRPFKTLAKFGRSKKSSRKPNTAITLKPNRVCCYKFLRPRPFFKFETVDKKIRFNTISKLKPQRRTLKSRNFVPFLSSTGRFEGDPFITILNQPVVDPIPNKVPNFQITNTPLESIKSRYLEIKQNPTRRKKKLFIPSVPPLPVPKALIRKEDFDFLDKCKGGFYYQPKTHVDYFKNRNETRKSRIY